MKKRTWAALFMSAIIFFLVMLFQFYGSYKIMKYCEGHEYECDCISYKPITQEDAAERQQKGKHYLIIDGEPAVCWGWQRTIQKELDPLGKIS